MVRARRTLAAIAILVVSAATLGCSIGARMPVAPAQSLAPTPVAPEPDPAALHAQELLKTMSLKNKVLSMLMVHLPGALPGINPPAEYDGVGGFILMGDNIPESLDELTGATTALSSTDGPPVLVATDQEGGIVRRILTDKFPAAAQLRSQPPQATYDAFAARGALLNSVGISVNFGIVADVVSDKSSFIFERSFGSPGADVAARVAKAVAGESQVLSTLKHFPGHGAAAGDSHSSIPSTPLTLGDWKATHALPFVAGIDAGAPIVMFGHLAFTAVDPEPATLSLRWHEILHDDLGFTGITITDDMNMLEYSGRPEYSNQVSNAVQAIRAGNTMLLYVGEVDLSAIVDGVTDAIEAGDLDETVIDDAVVKLLTVRYAN